MYTAANSICALLFHLWIACEICFNSASAVPSPRDQHAPFEPNEALCVHVLECTLSGLHTCMEGAFSVTAFVFCPPLITDWAFSRFLFSCLHSWRPFNSEWKWTNAKSMKFFWLLREINQYLSIQWISNLINSWMVLNEVPHAVMASFWGRKDLMNAKLDLMLSLYIIDSNKTGTS